MRSLSNSTEIQTIITRIAKDYFDADRCYYCEIEDDNAIIRRDASRDNLASVAGVYPHSRLPIHKALIDAGRPFIVSDVNTTELVDDELRQLCVQLNIISYINVPVIKGGKPVGILCITQCSPRNWTDNEVKLAIEVAERACAVLEKVKFEEELMMHKNKMLKMKREKIKTLEMAIKMKDEFLITMSHEFKTPLNVINAALQVLNELYSDEFPDSVKKHLQRIRTNCFRQLRLVNNLLDITRYNAKHIKVQKQNLDIVFLTHSITQSVITYAKQKNINLSFTSNIKYKEMAIDDEKYERILLNLLSNAIKFTPEGKFIYVNIDCKDRKVLISVKDEGIGIPKDKQEQIFERFGQVENVLIRQAEGTGIGLSLVKGLVSLLGGTIELESDIGIGSKFTVILPVTKLRKNIIPQEKLQHTDNRIMQAVEIEFSDIYL